MKDQVRWSKIEQCIKSGNDVGLMPYVGSDKANQLLTGFSGAKLTGTLQRLLGTFAGDESVCYVEIGVFQGLTLLSIADANRDIQCYGIDNFAYLDPDKRNLSIVMERNEKLSLKNVNIINSDYEDALANLGHYIGNKKIGLFFVDGPHDYRSQLICLQLALPFLHENAVIVVDDSNYNHVRQANADFLQSNREFKLFFEAYTHCHPANMKGQEKESAMAGWWNGVNIIVRDKHDELSAAFPATERNRHQFELDHIVHAHAIGAVADVVLDLWFNLTKLKVLSFIKGVAGYFVKRRKRQTLEPQEFKSMNTYSFRLTSGDYPWRDK